jgi:hypothetical protein
MKDQTTELHDARHQATVKLLKAIATILDAANKSTVPNNATIAETARTLAEALLFMRNGFRG